jgi:parallel beta-helix repeat protein
MIYNVKDFGALGDGITNDTLAIQAAVNAAHLAGGGSVYIPAGTYIVTGTNQASDGAIMLYDNITVYGDGMGATTVKMQDGWNHAVTGIFRDQTDVENHDITVHDLTIDGNRANTTGKIDGWFNGVSPGEPGTDRNITLDHVEIKDCGGYGFDPHEETTNLVITNCISHGNGIDGYTLDFQINARLENNIAYNNDRHGFNIVTSSHDVLLINNIAYGNGGEGIIVQRGSEDRPVPYNVVIQGGSVYGNEDDGIQINKADGVTIDGVDIHHNGQRGIRIIGAIGTLVENNTIHNNSQFKNLAFEEIRIESYDDTMGISGRIYHTSNTTITNNIITDDGAVRANYSVREAADGTDYTTLSNNTIYGTGMDRPLLTGSHDQFIQPAVVAGITDLAAPKILYAPLLGQSNAELMKLTAPDGGTGLSHVEGGLQNLGFDTVVTMTNMAVGGSTVDGDRSLNTDPKLVWWYPDQNRPGPALLNAVDQMQHQMSELGQQGIVTPIVIWGQGEAEANQLGTSKSDGGRRTAEMEYINSTRLVFNYIQDHVGHNVQFYLMETGIFNYNGAVNFGYPQYTIDKENLGLTYVHDAQVKMAQAYSDIHLAVNYSDLPMNADMPSDTPGYQASWASDAWHLYLTSKEIAADRLTNFIALDMGQTHVLDDPGPNYPRAALADLTIQNGPGVSATGNAHNNIIVGTTSSDTLSADGGNDVIVGGGGADTLSGGTGSDIFYYNPAIFNEVKAVEAGTLPDSRDIIADFQTGAGGDVIDVSALLKAAGYTGTNPVAGGYITVTQQGTDTVISFDQDGTGSAHSAIAIAQLRNVTASQFDIANNLFTQFPSGNALVLNAHQPPWARDDSFSGMLGQALHGNVLVNNGIGADFSPEGLALSTAAGKVNTAQGGVVTMSTSGDFDYTPAIGFFGADSFTYKLFDSAGGRDTGTVAISVATPAGALIGSGNNDIMNGTNRNDVMLGLNGNDTLNGGSGNDTLYAGAANDTLNGNSGNDILYAMSGNNILNGNDDSDTLYAGSGTDTLFGGNGADLLVAGTGAVTMKGGAGADMYVFNTMNGAANTIVDFLPNLGDKIDISRILVAYNPQTQSLNDFVHATAQGSDTVLSIDIDGASNGANFVNLITLQNMQNFDPATASASGSLIVSNAQTSGNHQPIAKDDTFSGWQNLQIHGNVLVDNGNGADSDPDGDPLSISALTGQTTAGGSVELHADGSFLYTPLSGYSGTDRFTYTLLDGHGGTAQGTVTVMLGGGTINGTEGDDIINGGSRDDIIKGLGGNDTLSGSGGNDTLYAGAGNDTLNGNTGNDILYAESGNNTLHGNDDNDILYGGTGIDALYGDNGNDILAAGLGGTIMTGGGGADTFLFLNTDGAVDTITDFRVSVSDKIDISDILQRYDPATQAIADFIHATKQGSNVVLSVDADGAANGAHFIDLAIIQGMTSFDPAAMMVNGNLLV